MSKGMLLALLVSIVLAVTLSFLPERTLEQYGGDASTNDTNQSVPVMKNASVVDGLETLSLHSHLQKVIWEKEKLTVYLAVPQAELVQSRPWQDVYKIAYRFLSGITEQREVVVKIVTKEQPDTVQYTVLAGTKDMAGAPSPDSQAVEAFVQQKLQVTKGNRP